MFATLFMGDSGSTKRNGWMDGWMMVGSMGVAAAALAISTVYCVCRMPRWPTYQSHSCAVLVHVMLTQTRSHLSVSEPSEPRYPSTLIVCFSIGDECVY